MALADPQVGRIIIDAGRGPQPATVILAGTVYKGDVLGYSTGWKQALATTAGVIQGRLIALKDGVSGDEIPVSQHPIVRGYTGGTAGSYTYVAEGTDTGKITETIPTTAGDATTKIGIMLNATDCQFFLNARVDSVV